MKEEYLSHTGHGVQMIRNHRQQKVTIELHLLTHHHRDDREGVHMPVGDISKANG